MLLRWHLGKRFGIAVVSILAVMGLGTGGASVAHAAECDANSDTCAIGDIGPGGGVVFYDAGSRQPWGRYLEVAPNTWFSPKGDPRIQWCNRKKSGYANVLKTDTRIGSGTANSQLIIDRCGTASAAGKANAYRGGGKKDWFLASKGELLLLWEQRKKVPNLPNDAMWSSSQWELEPGSDVSTDFVPTQAWLMFPPTGKANIGSKSIGQFVRPIRAF